MNEEIDIKSSFDEMLDEVYGKIKIGNLTFYPSYVLATCDPIAYELELDVYKDNLESGN